MGLHSRRRVAGADIMVRSPARQRRASSAGVRSRETSEFSWRGPRTLFAKVEFAGAFARLWGMANLRLACSLALGAALLLAGCDPQASIPQGIQVYFSPRGGATEAVVNALDQATNSVLVQAYSFTSAPIAKALVEAHRRGVKVQVILDDSQRTEKYSEADFLKNNGIPTLIDAQHAIAHNKIMIIDDCRGPHRLVQLHQGRGRAQRGEPAGDQRPSPGRAVYRELARPRAALGALRAEIQARPRKSEGRDPKTEGKPKAEIRTRVPPICG